MAEHCQVLKRVHDMWQCMCVYVGSHVCTCVCVCEYVCACACEND